MTISVKYGILFAFIMYLVLQWLNYSHDGAMDECTKTRTASVCHSYLDL